MPSPGRKPAPSPLRRRTGLRIPPDAAAPAGLLIAGCVIEAALLWGSLGPLSLAGHPGFFGPSDNAMNWVFGEGWPGLRLFATLIASLGVAYLAALVLAGRARGRLALTIACAGSVIFALTALLAFPADSHDVFHNIIDGRILWIHHLNPLVTPPDAVPLDPLYRYVLAWRDLPSVYGPLWYILTAPAALLAGNDRDSNIVAFKALPVAFELLSVGVAASIVHRIDPRRTAAAVVCLGWNPLLLWEVGANGHNDIVMIAFVLLALLLLLSTRWPLAFSVLACSVLVKYVSLILFPVFVLWILKRYGRRALLPLVFGLAGAGVIVVLVAAPFWAGPATWRQLAGQEGQMVWSVASGLSGDVGVYVRNTPSLLAIKAGLALVFAALYLLTLVRLRPAESSLIDVSVEALFLYLVLLTSWFVPWYILWALPLAALLPGTPHSRLIVLFSFTALLADCIAWSATVPAIAVTVLPPVTALLIFGAPVYYAVRRVWWPSLHSLEPMQNTPTAQSVLSPGGAGESTPEPAGGRPRR